MRLSIRALLGLLLCASPATAATITEKPLRGGATLIMIEGEITVGDDRRFSNAAARHTRAVVGLKSPGGAVDPALSIGRTIHRMGYATLVYDSTCVSACALIWVAGAERFVTTSGKIGFHAIYTQDGYGRQRETAMGGALVGQYLTELGLSDRAIMFATSAAPTHVNWLTSSKSHLIPFRIFRPGISMPTVLMPRED